MCLWREALGFFRGVGEHALALVGEREVDGGRDLLADGGVLLDLLADGFDGGVRAEKAVGERLVFAKKAQQEMFGFDVRRAKLAGLVAREEDHAPRLFCVAFEHAPPSEPALPEPGWRGLR